MQGERFEELFSSLPLKETYHDAIQTYYQRLPFLGSYALFESLFLELGKNFTGTPAKSFIPILTFLIIGIMLISIVCEIRSIPFRILM